MEDKKLDQLLKNALSTDFEPDVELNTRIMQKVKGNDRMKIKRIRRMPAAAVICLTLLCCSVTAFAAWKYIKPAQVAVESGDKQLAAAFESKDAISMNETQEYGDYTVSLLGAVSGDNLSDFCSADSGVSTSKTYAVVAIGKKDGSPMPDTSSEEYGKVPFFVSPLIQGLDPNQYNITTMNGGYVEIVKDGIMYRMIECDNVELFSDRGLYLCVSDTSFYDRDAYAYDEKTGEISVNSGYEGMNLLFDLPLNKDKADEKAAEEYLSKLAQSQSQDSQAETADKSTEEANATEETVDVNEIIKGWTLVSEEKVTPDADNRVYYSYETENGSGNGFVTQDALFTGDETGYSKVADIFESDTAKGAIVFYRDANGDITVSTYELKK